MSAPTPGADEPLSLRDGRTLSLDAEGARIPGGARDGATLRISWPELLHAEAGPRGLRLATPRGVRFVPRTAFEDRLYGPERALRAARLASRLAPGGARREERMRALDRLAGRPGAVPVTWILAGLCVALFAASWLRPEVHYAGLFSPQLVAMGELWRLATANLLHASGTHLALNLLGIAVIGRGAERALGARGAAVVVGASALGAMLGSWLRGYDSAVGASGIVYGLAGALVWLELARPDALPASWRIPRLALLLVAGFEALSATWLPFVAHAAHWGGFAAGVTAAAAVGPRIDAPREPGPLRRVAVAATALAFAVSLGAMARDVASEDAAAIAARGERLLALEGIAPFFLNNEAWRIAIAPEADAASLGVARRMAERAVAETRGLDPALLDTLAEVFFRQGDADRAVHLIEGAIALAPGESYYREQRRRFLGERDPDDRPEGPSPFTPEPEPEIPLDPDAVRV